MGLGGVLIRAAIKFFSKRDTGVILTREQAEHVKELLEKERVQISRQLHDVVDKGALDGETVSVSSFCVRRADATPEERAYIERMMQELIEKYGAIFLLSAGLLQFKKSTMRRKRTSHSCNSTRKNSNPFVTIECTRWARTVL